MSKNMTTVSQGSQVSIEAESRKDRKDKMIKELISDIMTNETDQ